MNITFIGDPHGKIDDLVRIVTTAYNSKPRSQCICVGDLGFKRQVEQIRVQLGLYSEHFFCVPGNHDYIPWKDKWPYLGDYHYFPDESIFTVRGADSIDKIHRIEGHDWFANEELTYQEGLLAYDEYVKVKPRIVVSHDCPQTVMTSLFGYTEKSTTRQLLEAMFEAHKPELYIFGHHHRNKDVNILGTRFVCLAELEIMKLEI